MNENQDQDQEKTTVASALFADRLTAQAAVRELREIGTPAEDISLLSSDDAPRLELVGERDPDLDTNGLPVDGDASPEENVEPGQSLPVVTDFEVPPDEPLGGSERLGIRTGDDERRPDEDYEDTDGYSSAPLGSLYLLSPAEARTDPVATLASVGSLTGLLAGVEHLTIPGTGPVIAAGPLAEALGGPITGSIKSALSRIGVPEEPARDYAARIKKGYTFISVRADDLTRDPIERVLVANGGESVLCYEKDS